MQTREGDIRKVIIEADLVDCMVARPGQLFYTSQIPVCLWFLARNKKNGRFHYLLLVALSDCLYLRTVFVVSTFRNLGVSESCPLPCILLRWLVVIAAKPVITHVPFTALIWLFAGGLAHTGGVMFFAAK